MIDKINGNGSYDLSGNSSKNKRKNPAVRAYESTPGSKDAAHKRTAAVRKKDNSSKNPEDAGVILDLSGKTAEKKKGAEAVRRKKDSSWTDAIRKLIHPLVQWLKDFWESDRQKEDVKVPAEEGANGAASEMPAGETLEGAASELSAGEALEGAASEVPAGEALESAASELLAGEALESAYVKLAVDERSMALLEGDLPPLDTVGMNDGRADAIEMDDLDTEKRKAIVDKAVRTGNLQQIEQLVTGNGRKRLAHNSDLLTYYDRRGKFVEIDETEKHRVLFGDKNVLKL